MPDGSQLLIITEAFVISEREGQGVGGELVREIGPRAWTSTNLFVISAYPHVQAGRLRVWVGKISGGWCSFEALPFLARSLTHPHHTLWISSHRARLGYPGVTSPRFSLGSGLEARVGYTSLCVCVCISSQCARVSARRRVCSMHIRTRTTVRTCFSSGARGAL